MFGIKRFHYGNLYSLHSYASYVTLAPSPLSCPCVGKPTSHYVDLSVVEVSQRLQNLKLTCPPKFLLYSMRSKDIKNNFMHITDETHTEKRGQIRAQRIFDRLPPHPLFDQTSSLGHFLKELQSLGKFTWS